MPAPARSDAEMEKMKDQIAKERDPRKRAELQKRLSELRKGSCSAPAAPSAVRSAKGGKS